MFWKLVGNYSVTGITSRKTRFKNFSTFTLGVPVRYSDSGEASQNSRILECGLKLSLVKSFFMHCMYRLNIGSSNVLYANVAIVHKIR